MKVLQKVVLVTSLSLALISTSSALAASVDGGTWHYGVGYTGTYGYSNYHHPDYSHTASVYNDKTEITNRQRAGAGDWAKAFIVKIPPTGLSYYYGF